MRIQLIAFLILLSCFNVFSKASAQKITIKVAQANLEAVLKTIEKQSGFSFAYDVSLLTNSKPITVQLKNASLKEALDELFTDLPYQYEIINKTILIKARPPVKKTDEGTKAIIIKGKVTDKQNIPLIGVSVRIKGSSTGTLTDRNGNYTITADPNGVIIFSYVGYQTFEIMINGQTEINMTMVESESQLQETVVKGYYKTTKELNTGAVGSITFKEIEQQPVSDPILALQGRVAGLSIQQYNGVLGRAQRVRLRGQNSLENGNEPLYIVDGVPYNSTPLNIHTNQQTLGGFASPFNYLNAQDIDRIDVLKDADATALYGSRGANGVILITTKKGRKGKTTLDLSIYQGFNESIKRVNFMNLDEYLAMRRQAFINDGKTPTSRDYDLNGTWDTTRYTDWQEYLLGGIAPVTEGVISVSGGSERTTFRVSSSVRSEGTVFPIELKSTKASGSLSVSHESSNGKFKANASSSYIYSENNLPVGGYGIESQIRLPPNAPTVYNEDGSLNFQNSTWENPLAIYRQTAEEDANNFITNLDFSYKIIDDLEIKSSMGFNKILLNQTNLRPYSSVDPLLGVNPVTFRANSIMKNELTSWIIEPQLSYRKSFNFGDIDALAGVSFQNSVSDLLSMKGLGYQSDDLVKNFASATTISGTRAGTEYRYNAIYARLGYNYHGRYVLNFTGRRDGSSRFGPKNRFGNFGSLGAAWIFSNEPWVKNNLGWLNFGKLRVSYGSTGNDQIGDYKYLDLYTVNPMQYQGNPGFVPNRLTNPYYGWERVNKIETGIELGVLANRLTIEGSYYQNRTKNQLVQYSLPSISGFTSIYANIPAVLQNSGVEITISSSNLEGNRFTWSTDINFTLPKNKLISYPGIEYSSYSRKYIVGQPTALSFVYHYLGKENNIFTFEDYNKDGSISNLADQIPIFVGQKYFGGINNTINYNGIELIFLIQFANQNGFGFYGAGTPGQPQNQPVFKGDDQFRQKLTQSDPIISNLNSTFYSSDAILKDASYISLKNLSVSYKIPFGERMSKTMPDCKVFARGQNLLTLSKYQGFHPEMPSQGINYPLQRVIVFGIKATIN